MNKLILLFVVAGGFAFGLKPACADDSAVPTTGAPASHYEVLWTKSPFAVATPDAVEDSPDYSLVGVTQLEGVSYASIVEKQNSDHFLISSDKPMKGLLLKTITRAQGATGDTYATVDKDGQTLTLKLESAPIAPPTGMPGGMPGAPPGEQPNATPSIMVPPVTQNIPMPGANMPIPASAGGGVPSRFIRIHRPTIHVPPIPAQQPQPDGVAPPPAAGAPNAQGNADQVQSHTPPPPQ